MMPYYTAITKDKTLIIMFRTLRERTTFWLEPTLAVQRLTEGFHPLPQSSVGKFCYCKFGLKVT